MVFTPTTEQPAPRVKVPVKGSRVKIVKPLILNHGTFSVDHEFIVQKADSFDVYLKDDEGNEVRVQPFLVVLEPV